MPLTTQVCELLNICSKGQFPLKPNQRDELAKWVSGEDYDAEWLKAKKDGLMEFIAGDGAAN